MMYYRPQTIFLQRIFKAIKSCYVKYTKTNACTQCRGVCENFHDTTVPSGHTNSNIFSLIKQIHAPHTNIVMMKRTGIKTKNMGTLNFNTFFFIFNAAK